MPFLVRSGLSARKACIAFLIASLGGVAPPAIQAETDQDEVDSWSKRVEAVRKRLEGEVRPVLQDLCVRCHGPAKKKGGVRLHLLSGRLDSEELFVLEEMFDQLKSRGMPPEDEKQPNEQQRKVLTDWLKFALETAERRPQEKNGGARRLTVDQYQNTLADLLGIQETVTGSLPPDSVSRDGFLNHGKTMLLTPDLLDNYFRVAEHVLDLCLVDESEKPLIQNLRVELGKSVNPNPCPDKLILNGGKILANSDVLIAEPLPEKPFAFDLFRMPTKLRYIEGYAGNPTVRGWRTFEGIYHSVFGLTIGDGEMVDRGLLLRTGSPGFTPHRWGPSPTFTVTTRRLPDEGRFRITIEAARYDGTLLLPRQAPERSESGASVVSLELRAGDKTTIEIPEAGIYQVDLYLEEGRSKKRFQLKLGDAVTSAELHERPAKHRVDEDRSPQVAPFCQTRLAKGRIELSTSFADDQRLRRVVLTRLPESSKDVAGFLRFEKRAPELGVHLGLRRDCGLTLRRVGEPQPVTSSTVSRFAFEGSMGDFPNPDVEANNVNYLAGLREIAVRNEYTDGRSTPRLLVRALEFEGPLYENWPPESHRRIFVDSEVEEDRPAYAREILGRFAARAYRRPPTDRELGVLLHTWTRSFAESGDFERSVRDALLIVLTSPQFLFLVEESASPEPEPLAPYELASKLSYFLWNGPPDGQLLELAAGGELVDRLDAEVDRLMADPKFERFLDAFTTQWLSLEKFDVVEIEKNRFGRLTHHVRRELRKEPVEYLKHLLRANRPASELVSSDYIVANAVVADYYGLGDKAPRGFAFEAVVHERDELGGLLTQAAILSGLSDGRESNPIKRGAWLARKIIADPPDDPPPNVPELPEGGSKNLTLRQRLERHRDQPGCRECHAKIDPWGVPFEEYNAGGLFQKGKAEEARSTLPDRTKIAGTRALKSHLAQDRIDQVAFSFMKHIAVYATGRTLSYHEVEYLREEGRKLRSRGYPLRDMLRFVTRSPIFLEK